MPVASWLLSGAVWSVRVLVGAESPRTCHPRRRAGTRSAGTRNVTHMVCYGRGASRDWVPFSKRNLWPRTLSPYVPCSAEELRRLRLGVLASNRSPCSAPRLGAGALRDGRRLTRPLVGTGHFPPSPRDRGKRRIGTDRVACRAWSSAPGVADEAAPLPSGDGDASKALPSFGFCPLLERRPSLAISSSLREKMWYDSDSRDGPGAPRASALLCRHLRVFPADWAHFQCPGPSVDLMNICDGTSAKGESERPIQGTP